MTEALLGLEYQERLAGFVALVAGAPFDGDLEGRVEEWTGAGRTWFQVSLAATRFAGDRRDGVRVTRCVVAVPREVREARVQGYRRRDPTATVLYGLLQEHVETFLAELDALPCPGLPRFVKRELRGFLECGILGHGFVRVYCSACGRDSLVAFACKGRGFCPSCGGRRMSATAAHLVDHVLPEASVRQWVLTLPFALRVRCAFDHELLADVRSVFVRAVFSCTARRAKAQGLEPGASGFRTGAVNVLQRSGGSLNLNPHFHGLFIDGVYTSATRHGAARFHELSLPDPADVAWTLRRIHSRLRRLFERRQAEGAEGEEVRRDHELLVHLASASVRGLGATGEEHGRPLPGLFAPEPEDDGPDPVAPPLVATGAGFSLHAGVSVPADRRGRLESLCRYVARPPLATERLSIDERGRILYALRHPYRGKTHAVFTPRTFLERLCAMIPLPRRHLVTYHGVLAPASSWRDEVVPDPPSASRGRACSSSSTNSSRVPDGVALDRRYRWAELMKRAFEVDVLVCECGAEREVLACITDRTAARRILRYLGLPDEPPTSAPPRAPPGLDFGA